jgi:hypothetical protein
LFLSSIASDPQNLSAINTLAGMGILTRDDNLVDATLSEILALPIEHKHSVDPQRKVDYLLMQHYLAQVNCLFISGSVSNPFCFTFVNLLFFISPVIAERCEDGGVGDSTGGIRGTVEAGTTDSVGEIDCARWREQRSMRSLG